MEQILNESNFNTTLETVTRRPSKRPDVEIIPAFAVCKPIVALRRVEVNPGSENSTCLGPAVHISLG